MEKDKKLTPDELVKLLDQELIRQHSILKDIIKRAKRLNAEIDDKLKHTNSAAYYELEDLLLQQELLLEEAINL